MSASYDTPAAYDEAVDSPLKAPEAAATGVAWATHDLSTWTKSDPGSLEGAGTALGTTSTIEMGTGTQGEVDIDRDGLVYVTTLVEGITWSDYLGLLVRLSGTDWGGPGSGAEARIRVGCWDDTDQATADGLMAGVAIQSGGTVYPQTITPGTNPATTVADAGDPPAEVLVWIPFDVDGPTGAQVIVHGATANEGRQVDGDLTATDLVLALALGNSAGLSSAAQWTGLQVQSALVEAP